MPEPLLPLPLTAPDQLNTTLAAQGYAVLSAASVCALAGVPLPLLKALEASWNDLPADQYLKDGGRYRRRRHASLKLMAGQVQAMPHRAHFSKRDRSLLGEAWPPIAGPYADFGRTAAA